MPYINNGSGYARWPYIFRPFSLAADWYSGVVRRDEIKGFDADVLDKWLQNGEIETEIAVPKKETQGLWISYTVHCTPSSTASPGDFRNNVVTTISQGITSNPAFEVLHACKDSFTIQAGSKLRLKGRE